MTSPSIPYPDRTHRSVGPEFTLPWNTTRTMAEVWGLDETDLNVERFRAFVTPPPAKPREVILPIAREIPIVQEASDGAR